jgi:hypothetical protein
MSDQENEQTNPDAPAEGDEAPPSVEPLSPPEPAVEDVQPVGQTQQAADGEPRTDQEQGVGVAPTQAGDAGEGNPGTQFETTEQIEGTDKPDDDDAAEHI